MSTFSKRLNTARRMRGLSQSDLASKTGLKQVAISFFETGRRAPSFGNLKRLADALEVTTDYLMGRSEFAEVPVEIVSKSFRDERKLSSKDVKFLRRVIENFIRAKNGQQQLRDGLKSGTVVTLGSLFS
jgi:transcriptional regulator with XRE-family HTH domain